MPICSKPLPPVLEPRLYDKKRHVRIGAVSRPVALHIDAKKPRAAHWNESYGAHALDDAPLSLVLPLTVVAEAIKRGLEAG